MYSKTITWEGEPIPLADLDKSGGRVAGLRIVAMGEDPADGYGGLRLSYRFTSDQEPHSEDREVTVTGPDWVTACGAGHRLIGGRFGHSYLVTVAEDCRERGSAVTPVLPGYQPGADEDRSWRFLYEHTIDNPEILGTTREEALRLDGLLDPAGTSPSVQVCVTLAPVNVSVPSGELRAYVGIHHPAMPHEVLLRGSQELQIPATAAAGGRLTMHGTEDPRLVNPLLLRWPNVDIGAAVYVYRSGGYVGGVRMQVWWRP